MSTLEKRQKELDKSKHFRETQKARHKCCMDRKCESLHYHHSLNNWKEVHDTTGLLAEITPASHQPETYLGDSFH